MTSSHPIRWKYILLINEKLQEKKFLLEFLLLQKNFQTILHNPLTVPKKICYCVYEYKQYNS